MITVHFPKYLQKLTNDVSTHQFDVETVGELIAGLRTLFPDLSLYISQIDSGTIHSICYFIDKEKEEVLTQTLTGKISSSELVLIISLYGQGDDVMPFVLGAALLAAGFAIGPATALVSIGGSTLLSGGSLSCMGINFLLSGFLSLLKPNNQTAPNAPTDTPVRAQNDSFGAFQNTTSTDTPIPLIFGYTRCPSHLVSGRIKTVQHDVSTTVSVANYV